MEDLKIRPYLRVSPSGVAREGCCARQCEDDQRQAQPRSAFRPLLGLEADYGGNEGGCDADQYKAKVLPVPNFCPQAFVFLLHRHSPPWARATVGRQSRNRTVEIVKPQRLGPAELMC